MSFLRNLLCTVTLAASALAAGPPNIILITLDTTRADRMGFLGSRRGLTPHLDALAAESVVFIHAYSQAPLTSVSHASILSGTYPQYHQVLDFPLPLGSEVPYAPDILRAHGYLTGAFLGSLALDPKGGAPGFDRGFDIYDAHFHSEDFAQKGRYQSIQRRGDEVVEHALAWLKQNPRRPLFLWVHLYDAHDPYDPPEPFKSRYRTELYDGGVAYVDATVGKLLGELKARGLYDSSVIAVMADHGESLGAHGEDTHGIFLYDDTIRVPLLIKPAVESAGAGAAGKRLENRVELVDVMPTLLEAAGIPIPAEVQGASLLGLMKGSGESGGALDAWRDRPAYARSDYAHIAYGWSELQALRTGKYLYVQAPRRELYDEMADPQSEHNLAGESSAVADTLAARLENLRLKTTSKRDAPQAPVDPAAQEKLAALGYIASNNVPKAGAAHAGADPKDPDNIEIVRVIRQVNREEEDGHEAEAIALLQKLVTKIDGVSILDFKLGEAYVKLHEYEKAIPWLRKAVDLAPGAIGARLSLCMSLMQMQDYAGAVPQIEELVARTPQSAESRIMLATAYMRTGQKPKAIEQYKTILASAPDHYEANLLLGRTLVLSGDPESAVPWLKKAASLQPNAPMPHKALSNAYLQLGKTAEATREGLEATRLEGKP